MCPYLENHTCNVAAVPEDAIYPRRPGAIAISFQTGEIARCGFRSGRSLISRKQFPVTPNKIPCSKHATLAAELGRTTVWRGFSAILIAPDEATIREIPCIFPCFRENVRDSFALDYAHRQVSLRISFPEYPRPCGLRRHIILRIPTRALRGRCVRGIRRVENKLECQASEISSLRKPVDAVNAGYAPGLRQR